MDTKKSPHQLILAIAIALVTTLAFAACSDDCDDLRRDVDDLRLRVEKLEDWCNTANSQISALQGLVSALEANDYVTSVTPIVEGSREIGYTIQFSKSGPITIHHGKDGANGTNGTDGTDGTDGKDGANGLTPLIGAAKDADGIYYWTVKTGDADPQWLTDAQGNKIPTTGKDGTDGSDGSDGTDAQPPVISVATFEGSLYWQVNGQWLLDSNNAKVPATGPAGPQGPQGDQGIQGPAGPQGDAVFAPDGVTVNKQAGYVTFTLADKITTFRLPLYGATVIRFENNRILAVDPKEGARAFLLLPNGFPKSDYGALMAEVVAPSGGNSTIVTRGTSNNWEVKLEPPVFHDNGNIDDPYVEITPPQGIKLGTKALLRVTLIHADGHESTVSRVIVVTEDILYDYTIEEQFTLNGIQPALQDPDQPNSATNPYLIKNAEHLQWIKRNPTEDYYYKLMKDIEVTGSDSRGNWVPIGRDPNNTFYGYFDGNGKKVYGKLVAPADVSYFGFFGYCRPIGIRDLHFTGTMDLSKATRFQSAGAIAGNMGHGTIKHCSNSADLTCKENVSRGGVGGIAGTLAATRGKIGIEACLNTGNIVSGKRAGGIVGRAGSSLVVGCINKGNMETTGFDYAYAGGITGEVGDHVMACWSKATSITHQNNGPAGGITGFVASGGKVETCCWKDIPGVTGIGEISSLASDPTGGLLEPFSGDRPTAEEITKMNEAWRAQNPSREYQFNATTGEIEAKP